MKTCKSVSYGKPDAGNPHVRFDEVEVASARPRRGSLLYNRIHKAFFASLVLLAAVPTCFATASVDTEDVWSRCACCFGAGGATADGAYVNKTLLDTMHATTAQSYGLISGKSEYGVVSNLTLDVFNPTASNAVGAVRCLYARQTQTASYGVGLNTSYTIAESQKQFTILTRVRWDATNTASTAWILAAHNWKSADQGGGGTTVGVWQKSNRNKETGKYLLRVVVGQSDNFVGSGDFALGEWVDVAVVGDDDKDTLDVGLKSTSDKYYKWYNFKHSANAGFFRPYDVIRLLAASNGDNPFHGAMQFFAIWNEALSKDDVSAAFSDHRRRTWSLGAAGCGTNVFAGASASTVQEVSTQITAWGKVPASIAANGGVRIPFTVRDNEGGLPQYVRARAAEGSGRFSVMVDATSVGVMDVAAGKLSTLYVAGTLLAAGAHTCTLTRMDASAGAVKLDFIDMGGSCQIGVDNDSTALTAGDKWSYARYRTDNGAVCEWKTVLKPIVTNEYGVVVRHGDHPGYNSSTNIHAFPVGIDYRRVTYRVKFYDPYNMAGLKLYLHVNGVLKATDVITSTHAVTREYTFAPGELLEGDNAFVWSVENAFRVSSDTTKDFYYRLDYQQFIIGRPRAGVILFVK